MFLNKLLIWTDDFFFLQSNAGEILVICNPQDSIGMSPGFVHSRKTLEEHIHFVQKNEIKRVMVVAENIDFLRQCPSIEELRVYPSLAAHNFDFSPLYDMPNLKSIICNTMYGPKENLVSHVDYSKFRSPLKEIIANDSKGHDNIHLVKNLTKITFGTKLPASKTLVGAFQGEELEELDICQSLITSLEGLGQAKKLRKLSLSYNRRLENISDLSAVKKTLTRLEIENCGRIKDFSVISQLHNLKSLKLLGSNVLPDLSFIKDLSNLRSFGLSMNVEDGDLSMCFNIPYVVIRDRRHYSHKDEDLPKNYSTDD